jgi:hypothetical protein
MKGAGKTGYSTYSMLERGVTRFRESQEDELGANLDLALTAFVASP